MSYAGIAGTEAADSGAVRAPAENQATCLIDARGLRKKYCRDFRRSLWYGMRDVSNALLLRSPDAEQLRPFEFWAVDRVSFQVRRGESLGLMGRNGAGKSTLLKLITGQRSLTAGRVTTCGRIVALTELGLGFDPALTGRENAYMNAAILGLPRHRLAPIIEEIIDFAGIRDFIDSAVQTYSSGMKARLGFSVAAHLEPDILIVDEVLAVGDLAFRRKCVQHVLGYLRRGGSLVLVAHDPYLVQSVCNRCLILDRGCVVFDGDPVEGVKLYLDMGRLPEESLGATGDGQTDHNNWLTPVEEPLPPRKAEVSAEHTIVIDAIEIVRDGALPLVTGCAAIVRLRCRSRMRANVGWGFMIRTQDMRTTISSFAIGLDGESVAIGPGENVLECRIPDLPLRAGEYAVCGGVSDPITGVPIALLGFEGEPGYFRVVSEGVSRSGNLHSLMDALVEIPVEWTGAIHSPRAVTAEGHRPQK